MARTVSLSTIANRARVLADQRAGSFVNDDEMLELLNDNYTELFDVLVDSFGNYFSTTQDVTIASGTSTYPLPTDFYKLIGAEYQVNASEYVPLKPFLESDRGRYLASNTASGTVRLRYVPTPTTFTDLATDTIDGIAGWERLLVLAVAIDMMDAEESDTRPLVRKYNNTLERIQRMSHNRDVGQPQTITDVYCINYNTTIGNSMRYRLDGSNIEFISTIYAPFP